MRCSVLISAELGRGRLDREPFRARLRAGSAPLLGTSPHKDNILASRDPPPRPPPRSGEGGGTGVGARFFRRCNLCVPTLPPAVRSAGPLFARSFSFFTAPLVSARSRLLSLPFLRRPRSPPPSLPPHHTFEASRRVLAYRSRGDSADLPFGPWVPVEIKRIAQRCASGRDISRSRLAEFQ